MTPGANRTRRGLGGATLCVLAAAGCFAATAHATVKIEVVPAKDGKSAGTLRMTGDGDGDLVYLDIKDGLFNVATPGKDPTAESGCEKVPTMNEVNCGSSLASVYANLGEGDNQFNVFQTSSFNSDLTVTYVGGSGADHVEGGNYTTEMVDGRGGDDVIGTGGNFASKKGTSEVLKGGLGNDQMQGGKGPDLIDGEGGDDTMYGDNAAATEDDGIDHIDASETPENGETHADKVIDCGGKDDTYQLDDKDIQLLVEPKNCEKKKTVAVALSGAGDPAAGAIANQPKPEEKVKVEVEAEKKTPVKLKGKIVIPGELGEEPKGKTARKSAKAAVIPIKARTLKLRPGVERVLELDLSKSTERAIRRSLRKGKQPTLRVSVTALAGKGRAAKDSETIPFRL